MSPRVLYLLLSYFLLTKFSPIEANNYDDYLRRLLQLSNAAKYEYTRDNPSGAYVLDHISSPEFLNSHLGLGDYTDEEFTQTNWLRLVKSLEYANEAAKHKSEVAEELLKSDPWVHPTEEIDKPKLIRRLEIAPQNHLWGEHRVSGGSSEDGRWMEYAVLGAHAQDDEDDAEIKDGSKTPAENAAEVAGESLKIGKAHTMGVKVDNLPAYCSPPNPCPINYDPSKLATPCDEDIPNTKEFNKAWIMRSIETGMCSCDTEHMESCSVDNSDKQSDETTIRWVRRLGEHFIPENPYLHGNKRSRLVAKKTNRFLKRANGPAGSHLKHIVKENGRQQ